MILMGTVNILLQERGSELLAGSTMSVIKIKAMLKRRKQKMLLKLKNS